MTQKLTLSIDEKTVLKARRISRKRGKSISRMVEEYLNSITEKENQKESAVKKTSGVLKDRIPASVDWKKTKVAYLGKKHGI